MLTTDIDRGRCGNKTRYVALDCCGPFFLMTVCTIVALSQSCVQQAFTSVGLMARCLNTRTWAVKRKEALPLAVVRPSTVNTLVRPTAVALAFAVGRGLDYDVD